MVFVSSENTIKISGIDMKEYLEQKLERLEKQIAYLERRIDDLEKANRMHHPFQPIAPPAPYNPQPTWVIPNACHVCGLEFKGSMGYVCTNPKCPTAITC